MIERFTTQQSTQREWAWLLTLYLFLGSLGGCLFLLVRLLGLPRSFAFVSIGLVALGGIAVLFKLGSPQRAWRALSRPTTSWISRGAWFVAGFFVFGCLSVAPSIAALSWLPWNDGTALGVALAWIAAVFAFLTAVYPGFVVSNSRAIPFWNTPLLPLLFFTYAALAATGVVLIGSAAVPGGAADVTLWAEGLIVGNAVLSAVYLFAMKRAGGSAAASVHRLNQGSLGAVYWLGVVVIGLIVPLSALLSLYAALAGVAIQIGALLFRYCVLKAGIYYGPVAVTPATTDFSTLTRTSADFAREYAGMTSALGRR
jgi:formate-dependent nitrite reductase membrane component NrfD